MKAKTIIDRAINRLQKTGELILDFDATNEEKRREVLRLLNLRLQGSGFITSWENGIFYMTKI
jgi:hypothetical protein